LIYESGLTLDLNHSVTFVKTSKPLQPRVVVSRSIIDHQIGDHGNYSWAQALSREIKHCLRVVVRSLGLRRRPQNWAEGISQ